MMLRATCRPMTNWRAGEPDTHTHTHTHTHARTHARTHTHTLEIEFGDSTSLLMVGRQKVTYIHVCSGLVPWPCTCTMANCFKTSGTPDRDKSTWTNTLGFFLRAYLSGLQPSGLDTEEDDRKSSKKTAKKKIENNLNLQFLFPREVLQREKLFLRISTKEKNDDDAERQNVLQLPSFVINKIILHCLTVSQRANLQLRYLSDAVPIREKTSISSCKMIHRQEVQVSASRPFAYYALEANFADFPTNPPECSHRVWTRHGRERCPDAALMMTPLCKCQLPAGDAMPAQLPYKLSLTRPCRSAENQLVTWYRQLDNAEVSFFAISNFIAWALEMWKRNCNIVCV